MKEIIALAKALSVLRQEVNNIKELTLQPLQERRDEVQANLIAKLKEAGLKSLKTDTHNFARTVKKDIRVSDEKAVMDYLEGTDNYDLFVQPKLDTAKFKSFAKSTLKGTGEVVPGIEPTESEYMSITSVKE